MASANRPAQSLPQDKKSRSALRFVLKLVGYGALGLLGLLLLLIPILTWALDLGSVVRKRLVEHLPEIEQQLGRPIVLGQVKLRLLPSIEAEVKGLGIGPAAGATGPATQPLVKLGSVRVGISVWSALRSLGKEVQVSRLELDGLEVTVVRAPDGRLSYEDILEHRDKKAPPSKPLTPEVLQYLRGLDLSRLALTGASLRFYDLEAGGQGAAPVQIDQLDIIGNKVRLMEPFTVTLDAAVLSPQRNVHFAASVGPFPADLEVEDPVELLRSVELRIAPVQLGPVLRFLPVRPGIGVVAAAVDADLKLTRPSAGGKLVVLGEAGLRGLLLRNVLPSGAQALGAVTDIRLKTDLEAEPLAGSLQAKSVELQIGDMAVKASADLRSLFTTPAVHSITLSSNGLLLEKLLSILPQNALPKGTVVRGPVVLHASGNGSPTQAKVALGIDLTGATLLLPTLHKPERTPLSVQFQGQLTGGGIDIERLGLVLGPLSLWLKGAVRGKDFDLTMDTGKVDLDSMLRLLPTVVKSVPPGAHLGGALHVEGKFHRKAGVINADARVVLSGADARTPALALTGEADLSAKLRSSGSSASVEGNLDLTPTRILVPGTVDKEAGVPMRLTWAVEQSGQQLTVRHAELALPGSVLQVKGQTDAGGNNINLTVPLCDLDMQRLGQVVPALHRHLPGFFDGHLKFTLALSGDPKQLGSLHAKLDKLDFALAGGRLTGGAEVVGLTEPKRVTFDLRADGLDLDRLSGGGGEEATSEDRPAKRADKAAGVPRFLRTLDMTGTFKLDGAKTHGTTVRGLLLEVTMTKGKALLKTLQMGMFGGRVEASGTSIDFGPTPAKLNVRTKLQKIEASELLAMKSPALGEKFSGQGNLNLSVDGAGLSWEELAHRLSGDLAIALANGKLRGFSLGGQVVGTIVEKLAIAGLKDLSRRAQEMSFENVACEFAIKDGKLHTSSPIHLKTAEGALTLAGTIGLDSSLDMTGHLELAPQVLATATGGLLSPSAPVPVDFKIGGTLQSPALHGIAPNVQSLLAGLPASLLKGKAKDLLGNLPGGLGQGLGGVLNPGTPGGAATQPKPPDPAEEARKRLRDGLKGLF